MFFNIIVFPEPGVKLNCVHRESPPVAIPIISEFGPTDIVTIKELASIVLLP